MQDIPAFFERYQWSYTPVGDGVWRSTFTTEREEEFDVYVADSEDWVHFAVSPFTPPPLVDCIPPLFRLLLELNQQMRLARFAVDTDGDVNLLLDLPHQSFDYPAFEAAIDSLVYYTRLLGHELGRTATEPDYRPSIYPT